MTTPILSLCMIVRDEEDMLPDFLASVEGLWDEFIVADTGSADQSVALLEAAGAQVVHHVWQDDFAAARNASLAPATGRWILFLDADERVSPQLHAEIRTLITDESAGAATVRLRNDLPGGHYRQSPLLRMFRNDPQIRFNFRIHEDVSVPVDDFLQRTGLEMRHLSGVVFHLGYVREVAAARDKKSRDLNLLLQLVQQDPQDLYSWFKILEQARFWSDMPLWRETAIAVEPLLAQVDASMLKKLACAAELVSLASEGLYTDPDQSLVWLDQYADRITPTAAFFLRRGNLLETLGRLDEAVLAYESCRTDRQATSTQLVGVRPLLGLCRVAAARGDLAEAQRLALAACRQAPEDEESVLAAVTFSSLSGNPEALDSFCDTYVKQHGRQSILTAAVGTFYLETGRYEEAVVKLREAAGNPPTGPHALLLGKALLAAGDIDGSVKVLESLVSEQPQAALGLLTCALTLNRDIDLQVDLDQETADQHLRQWVALLWRSRQTELMSAFAENCGSVVGLFPWLPEFLQDETRKLQS